MDLLEAIKEAPLWVKVDLAIVQAAALYTAIRILWPIVRWLRMTLLKIPKRIMSIRDDIIWMMNRPSVRLIEEPSSIVSIEEQNVYVWSTSCKVRFKSRDKIATEVKLSQVRLCVEQGKGRRVRKTVLEADRKKTEKSLMLQPKGSPSDSEDITIHFERTTLPSELAHEIELDKSFEWKIYGITAKVRPLLFRELRSFKGKQNGEKGTT